MTSRTVTVKNIENAIQVIRGHRVMIDADLAKLYGVLTKNLNKAVKRNQERFPEDFMFRLTAEEANGLRFQTGTSKKRGGRRTLPYAFTEHGVVMLANVLSSPRAVAVSIEVVRVFVRLRQAVTASAELAHRLAAVEASLSEHRIATGGKLNEHGRQIEAIIEAVQQLIGTPDEAEPPPIGFEIKRLT